MVAVEVVRIGWQHRDMPEALIIDVAAIEVWRRWWNAEIRVRGIAAKGFGRVSNDLGLRSSLLGGRRARLDTQLIGIALLVRLAGGPQAVAMLTGEACCLLDSLLVLHVRRKGRLRGITGTNHRLVDQIDRVPAVKPDVAQEATESVALGDIGFQVELASGWQESFEERGGLGAIALGWVVGVASFRSIDEDEAQRLYLAADVDANRIAVRDADQRCSLRSRGNLVRPSKRDQAERPALPCLLPPLAPSPSVAAK